MVTLPARLAFVNPLKENISKTMGIRRIKM